MVFKADDTWYLQSLNSTKPEKMFIKRRLFIGKCPKCKKEVVMLVEVRAFDNRIFVQIAIGANAERIKNNEKKRIIYTSNSVPKGKLSGFVYGENVELHCRKQKGEKVGKIRAVKQNACDWNKQKCLVKEVRV